MNFQDLKKVEDAQFYLDTAINKAERKIKDKRSELSGSNRFQKSKHIEQIRLEIIATVLNEHLTRILESFPNIDSLDDFYNDLIRLTLDYRDLKQSLGAVRWATKTVLTLFKTYRGKLNQCQDMKFINQIRRQYVGRVSSVVNQIKQNLFYLEECRKTMKSFPAVKTNIFTICLFGFPNVGKSTLLKKLTNANPEVNSYSFTTKKLNFGYITTPITKIQVIDTPGTLNRQDKMNYIEIQAYLALQHLANLVVFVFDPTPEYSFEKQVQLLEKVKKMENKKSEDPKETKKDDIKKSKKEVVVYISKTDIARKEDIKLIQDNYETVLFDDLEKLFIKKSRIFHS